MRVKRKVERWVEMMQELTRGMGNRRYKHMVELTYALHSGGPQHHTSFQELP